MHSDRRSLLLREDARFCHRIGLTSSRRRGLLCVSFATDQPAKQSKQKVANRAAKQLSQIKSGVVRTSHLKNNIVPKPSTGLLKSRWTPQKGMIVTKEKPDGLAFQQPVLMVLSSALLLGAVCGVSGETFLPLWMPIAAGAGLGGNFALLGHHFHIKHWQLPLKPLKVVITGSTKGIGKAMAREFLRRGDMVMVTSRASGNVRRAVAELLNEIRAPISLFGRECDVQDPRSVKRLVIEAKRKLGQVDVWINNAGCSGSYQDFLTMSDRQVEEVVNTNLLGSLLCTKAAQNLMRCQVEGGHIFNMNGAGSDGSATTQYAAYGATKAGIQHLQTSLDREVDRAGRLVKIHTLSPGMVLTKLLLDGATIKNKFFFNILAVLPETSAAYLVPRVRCAAATQKTGRRIQFLTPWRALSFLLTAPFRLYRFFDHEGKAIYLDEECRFLDKSYIDRWLKDGKALAVQDRFLAVSYSLSMTATYLLLNFMNHS